MGRLGGNPILKLLRTQKATLVYFYTATALPLLMQTVISPFHHAVGRLSPPNQDWTQFLIHSYTVRAFFKRIGSGTLTTYRHHSLTVSKWVAETKTLFLLYHNPSHRGVIYYILMKSTKTYCNEHLTVWGVYVIIKYTLRKVRSWKKQPKFFRLKST